MQNSEKDVAILNLIQRTPHLWQLARLLRRRAFPSVDERGEGTRFQKCRRLYDTLLQECFTYYETRGVTLRKVFHDSGNSLAGELLYALRPFVCENIFEKLIENGEQNSKSLTKSDGTTDTLSPQDEVDSVGSGMMSMMRVFLATRSGNAKMVEKLLLSIAARCCIDSKKFEVAALNQHRKEFGNILLTKRDWMDKTVLHVVVDGKSVECLEIILKYAEEARIKSELLDAQDAFGQTALHLAIRRRNVPMTRKLIIEGANLFIENNCGFSCVFLIFKKLHAVSGFLLDTCVSISGDVSSDTLYFNVDFDILTTFVSGTGRMESRLKRSIKKKVRESFMGINMEDLKKCRDELQKPTLDASSSSQSLNPPPRIASPEDMLCSELTRELTVLSLIISTGQWRSTSEILSHPVVQTLLDLKWKRMKILLLISYTGLRISVYSSYIALIYYFYFITCPATGDPHLKEENKEEQISYCTKRPPWSLLSALIVTLLFMSTFSIHKIRKFWQDYCEASSTPTGKTVGIGLPLSMSFGNSTFLLIVLGTTMPLFWGQYSVYQYPLATLGIILCSGLILEVIGNSNWDFGIHSIYVHVYGKVMLRFISVIATFSPVIVTFSLAFNIMYPQVKEFATFWRALLRLVIMLQGEFDYEDKVQQFNVHIKAEGDMTLQFWCGQLLFGILGCVLSLVLIDVFLGYTVSDIGELKKQAEFVRRRNQIVQMSYTEAHINGIGGLFQSFHIDISHLVEKLNIISVPRKINRRNDVVISCEEIPENRLIQFRKILIEQI